MQKPHNTFITNVNKTVESNFYWKVNADYAPGVPDCFYEGSQRDLWIEYKYTVMPKRDSTLIKLTDYNKHMSLNQQKWIKRRYLARGDAWVILGTEQKAGYIFNDLSWKIPISTGDVKAGLLTFKEIAQHINAFINST